MPLFQRLSYAVSLSAVLGAFIGLVIAIASSDTISLLPTSSFDLIMSPVYMLVIFVVAFFLAPFLSSNLPRTGWENASNEQRNSSKNFYGMRQIFIVFFGLILIGIANLIVYFIDGRT